MLVAVVQRWGLWTVTGLSSTKANVLDSSIPEASAGSSSLITHSTIAEGIDVPGNIAWSLD